MNNRGRSLALALILVLSISSASLLMVKPASAQSTSTPTVPIFTLKIVNQSIEVNGTTTIDPYTGQNVTSPSYYLQNDTIEITITNQPNQGNLYYNVRVKGHFAMNWTELYPNYYTDPQSIIPAQASFSNYTVIATPQEYPTGGKVDFQVEALTGYFSYQTQYAHGLPITNTNVFTTTSESGWSPTQTMTIQSSTVPEFPALTILPLILLIISSAFVIKRKMRSKV